MSRFLKSAFLSLILGWPAIALAITAEPPVAGEQAYLFQLSYDDAEKAISDALAEKGAGERIKASITNRRENTDAVFSYSKPISVEIRGLTFDKARSHWSASLLAVSENAVITATPVSGRYDEIIETPVLKRQVRAGELITEEDIELRDFPIARTRAGTITKKEELVGKSPIRTVSALRPIRENEIEQPSIIKKNSIVQMRYISPGMEITTTGQALAEGSKGSMITVRNLSSKKVIRATVVSESTVDVLPDGAVPSNLEANSLTGDTHAKN